MINKPMSIRCFGARPVRTAAGRTVWQKRVNHCLISPLAYSHISATGTPSLPPVRTPRGPKEPVSILVVENKKNEVRVNQTARLAQNRRAKVKTRSPPPWDPGLAQAQLPFARF